MPFSLRHATVAKSRLRSSSDQFQIHQIERTRNLSVKANSLLRLYLTALIDDAAQAVPISQIESDGEFLLRNIPALLRCCGANLLHCRSPFYLCLKHVDNLGAYSIPSETGLLIPSVFDSLD